MNRALVGRCGLYCGACGIYRAQRDQGILLERLANGFKCPPEKVRCNGCGALTPECWGYNCRIVKCLTARGLEFCYQCDLYEGGCEKFGDLARAYLNDNGVDLRENLERIRLGETEAWLLESEEKYKCRSCGQPLPFYGAKGECYHCGAAIPW